MNKKDIKIVNKEDVYKLIEELTPWDRQELYDEIVREQEAQDTDYEYDECDWDASDAVYHLGEDELLDEIGYDNIFDYICNNLTLNEIMRFLLDFRATYKVQDEYTLEDIIKAATEENSKMN